MIIIVTAQLHPPPPNIQRFRSQIISGGQNIVRLASKGGAGYLNTLVTPYQAHDVLDHVNFARQDLAKGNIAAAYAELNNTNAALKNDSITISGLGQELTSLAQNKSMPLNSNNARLMLSTIGNDLSRISFQIQGVSCEVHDLCY
jgi:hypothetical protein